MLTSKWHSIKTALIISCFSILIPHLYSQCSPPDQTATVNCDSADLFCLYGYCTTSSIVTQVCCMNFCGLNTIVNNPQYFQFIPTDVEVEIDIHVDNCTGGSGLQSAIVTSCNWAPCQNGNVPCPDVLACNPGTPPGGTMVLHAVGLVIGQPYWLLIDGTNGSTCEYSIEYISGVFGPQLTGELDPQQTFTNTSILPQGYTDLHIVTGPSIGNAHGYYWTFGWNNDTITTTLPELNINIAANAPPGIWNICVHAFSGCDTTENEICTPIEITSITATEPLKDETVVSIFPNPTKDKLQINLPKDISLPMHWNLLDQLGIKQVSGVIHSASSQLDLENILPGVYFLELDLNNDIRRVLKVIRE